MIAAHERAFTGAKPGKVSKNSESGSSLWECRTIDERPAVSGKESWGPGKE